MGVAGPEPHLRSQVLPTLQSTWQRAIWVHVTWQVAPVQATLPPAMVKLQVAPSMQ